MVQITRLFDFPYYQLEKNNIPDCLVTKYNGEWVKTSTQEYINKSNAISRALLRLGVQKNDKIAIISTTNRTEWNIMDIGSLQVGAQTVPVYPTISPEEYEYVADIINNGNIAFPSDRWSVNLPSQSLFDEFTAQLQGVISGDISGDDLVKAIDTKADSIRYE